jgi:hypothetical protein
MTTIYEVDNAARASYERNFTLSAAEKEWLEELTNEQLTHLPREYQWLHDWVII